MYISIDLNLESLELKKLYTQNYADFENAGVPFYNESDRHLHIACHIGNSKLI